MGDRRGRCVFVVGRQHDIDAMGGQHLEAACTGGLRQRMGVDAEEERPTDIVSPTVIAYRLRDGEHVRLIE